MLLNRQMNVNRFQNSFAIVRKIKVIAVACTLTTISPKYFGYVFV